MKTGGRIAATIGILNDVLNARQPVKTAIRDWSKSARYAGAKDRAWISGLLQDVLRRRNFLAHTAGSDGSRLLVLAALRYVWDWPIGDIEIALNDPHAPEKLSVSEREALIMAPEPMVADHIRGDFPEWMTQLMQRAFGPDLYTEMDAMNQRANVDLRINTLKADTERAEKALRSIRAITHPLITNAFQIPAPHPSQREQAVNAIPAYSRGWVEIQDAGSQIAALACNAQSGEQILDYCAGGGGKTLALAASMKNSGQIYAHDIDRRRLSALIPRLRRAGVRNCQLCDPAEISLDSLKGKMDAVLIDAPCTGTGTWRRRPETKWRLSRDNLAKRITTQSEILQNTIPFLKAGGRIVYITCSFLIEENEDQIRNFLAMHPQFIMEDAVDHAINSNLLTLAGQKRLKALGSRNGWLKLTPKTAGTDGFFVAVLRLNT